MQTNENQYRQRGIFPVIYEKFCFWVELNNLWVVILDIFLFAFSCAFIFLFWKNENIKDVVQIIFRWRNFFIGKSLGVVAWVFTFRFMILHFRLPKKIKPEPEFFGTDKKNTGISMVEELAQTRKFNAEVARRFGIDYKIFPKIRDELFSCGMLGRGKDNAIVIPDNVNVQKFVQIVQNMLLGIPAPAVEFSSQPIR